MLQWIVSATALLAAVLLVRALLGRRMGAGLRYGLWLLVLVRLLVPLHFGQSAAAPANLVRPAGELSGVMLVLPVASGTPEDLGVADTPAGPVDTNSAGTVSPNADGTATRFLLDVRWPAVLRTVWIAGMAVTAAWFAACNVRFARRLRRSRAVLEAGRVPVYRADVPSPCVFGVFRPAVYVNGAALAEPERLRLTLLHERTHLRHGDHLWALLRTVCLVLWWYHPLVWLAARLSRQDGELFCDDAVLRGMKPEERTAYGQTLLALAARRSGAAAFSAASTLSRSGRQLKARIVAIARGRRTLLWVAVPAACSFAGPQPAAEQPADPEPSAAAPSEPDTPEPDAAAETDEPSGSDQPAQPRPLLPLIDTDLTTGDGVALGMSWDEAQARMGEPDAVSQVDTGLSVRKDGIFYSFHHDDSGGYYLARYSGVDAGSGMPLGLGSGSTLEDAMALLGLTEDAWDAPYTGEPGSVTLERGGDGLPRILALTDTGSSISWTFDRESRLWGMTCIYWYAEPGRTAVRAAFQRTPPADGAVLWAVDATLDRSAGILGAALYTLPGADGSFWLAFLRDDGVPAEVYFTAVGIGSADDPLTFDPQSLLCQGADTAAVQVRDDGGQLLSYTVTCTADEHGVHFTAQSTPVTK